MKHINEYLLSKNKNKIVDDFRQFKTKEEVCNFFDSKGFEKNENESDDYDAYDDMISEFSNSDNPIYCIGKFNAYDHNCWVRFGKGGKDEYIFFWNVKDPQGILRNYCVSDSNDNLIKKFKTFEEFKDYVKNYFEW